MTKFRVTILGSGSAMPTTLHNPPAQLVELNDKLFMIDCGEGTQLQMRRFKARMGKLHSVFISHLHGDHIFGLPGLLSTLSLLGRTSDLNIYAHKEIDFLINPFLIYMGKHMSFKINVIPLNPESQELIFENQSIKIYSFPLKHRIDTNGFLFEEKKSANNIIKDMIDFHKIPFNLIYDIKRGADYIAPDGEVIKNDMLTLPGIPSKKYAYCSDTAYAPEIIQYIKKVDLLYHEATFAESEIKRAEETYHSTASQAASIAKLAEAKKLVIGHYSSRYNEFGVLLKEASLIFPETELASEGKIFEL